MQKSLCIFLCALLLGYALGNTNQTTLRSNQTSPNSTKTPRLNVTNSGNIPLYKDSQGFYAGVDLAKDDSSWPYYGPNTVSMLLGLYTSQTLLVTSCMSFTQYDCQKYQCTQYGWMNKTVQYPYFIASGFSATAEAYLDYSHWSLGDYALIAATCSSGGMAVYGYGMSGILGLGLNTGNGLINYNVGNPVFSLYLKPVNNQAGYLMFQKDLRYASSSSPIATLKTDKNWRSTFNGYIQVGVTSVSLYNVSLIFDLYADTIGFPSTVYNSVLQYLGYAGAYCSGNYRASCSYGSYMSRLPTLAIQLNYPNSGNIYLPPEVYVYNYSSYANSTYVSSFTLNLRALGSNLPTTSYVTPDFNNTLILNSDVLSRYYSVFDASSPNSPYIYLYNAVQTPPIPGSTSWWNFVIGGVVLAIIICACCRCCCRPKVINTVQTPLILNDETQAQFAKAPILVNYAYPQTVYGQQPQVIIQPAQTVYTTTTVPTYTYNQVITPNGPYQTQ